MLRVNETELSLQANNWLVSLLTNLSKFQSAISALSKALWDWKCMFKDCKTVAIILKGVIQRWSLLHSSNYLNFIATIYTVQFVIQGIEYQRSSVTSVSPKESHRIQRRHNFAGLYGKSWLHNSFSDWVGQWCVLIGLRSNLLSAEAWRL